MEKITIKSSYELQSLYLTIYEAENSKGVVQIVHGMKEHQDRYADFALFLNANGYSVVTSDLRGHGPNATLLGFMEGKKPWEALLADQVSITDFINERFPTQDVFLFAHSMGTIISRNLIQTHANRYKKVILSGVPAYQFGCHFGILLANIIGVFKSNTYISKLLESQTLKKFEKAVPNALTKADWVSVSRANINAYLNDPYCDIPFTVSAYKALFHLVKGMQKHKKYVVDAPEKPILMIVGALDPCTLGEKGLNASSMTIQKAGYTNIKKIIYENMRHEILNEEDHQKVYDDVLEFLN